MSKSKSKTKKPFIIKVELEFEDVVLAETAEQAEAILAKRFEGDITYAVDQLFQTAGNISFSAEEVNDKEEIPEILVEDGIDKIKKDNSYNKIITLVEDLMDKDEELKAARAEKIVEYKEKELDESDMQILKEKLNKITEQYKKD